MTTDVTGLFANKARYHICPDCGCPDIILFDDFCWRCPDCGWEKIDQPGYYLSAEELLDWKAGMWGPSEHEETSLFVGYQVFEDGLELECDVIDFDVLDTSVKHWLVSNLLKDGKVVDRELRIWMGDFKSMGEES